MYRLYWEALSGAMLPEVMFEEMALPYERIPVDMDAGEHRSPEYLAINPAGQVPALALPDGRVIGESAAMALIIGERHPEGGLVPAPDDDDRPEFLRWLLFMATSVYMTFVRVNHPERFTTDPDGTEAVRAGAVDAVARQFALLDEAIAGEPWFLPRGYGALDIQLAMLAGWHPDPAALRRRNPAVERLCAAAEARPAYARVLARHRG